jgi:hypothetical protein
MNIVQLDNDCSKALRHLVSAFEQVKALQINENFAMDFLFSQVPGHAGGELESYRKCHFRREHCGAVQDALLTPEDGGKSEANSAGSNHIVV